MQRQRRVGWYGWAVLLGLLAATALIVWGLMMDSDKSLQPSAGAQWVWAGQPGWEASGGEVSRVV